MCGHVLLVLVDSRLALVTNVIESRLPVLHVLIRPSRRLTPCHSHRFSHSTHCRTLIWLSQCLPNGGLTVSARVDLSSTLTPPAVEKVGLLHSNVTRFLCALPSAT